MEFCFVLLLTLFSFHLHGLAISCTVKKFELMHIYDMNNWEGYLKPVIEIECTVAGEQLGTAYLAVRERQPIASSNVTIRRAKVWYEDRHFKRSGDVFTVKPSMDDKLLDGEYALPGIEYNMTLKISRISEAHHMRIGLLSPPVASSLIIPPNPVEELRILTTDGTIAINYTIRFPGYYDALQADVWIDDVEHLESFHIVSKADIDAGILKLLMSFNPNKQYDVMVWMKSGGTYSDPSEASYIPSLETNRSSKAGLLKIMLIVLVACSMSITTHYPFIG